MPDFARNLAAASAAIALCSASAVATASSAATTSPAPIVSASSNPWITLSALTTGSAATSSAAVAQGEGNVGDPPKEPLAVILATIATAVYILLDDDNDNLDVKLPVSPS
jgi:hypothetical protein